MPEIAVDFFNVKQKTDFCENWSQSGCFSSSVYANNY